MPSYPVLGLFASAVLVRAAGPLAGRWANASLAQALGLLTDRERTRLLSAKASEQLGTDFPTRPGSSCLTESWPPCCGLNSYLQVWRQESGDHSSPDRHQPGDPRSPAVEILAATVPPGAEPAGHGGARGVVEALMNRGLQNIAFFGDSVGGQYLNAFLYSLERNGDIACPKRGVLKNVFPEVTGRYPEFTNWPFYECRSLVADDGASTTGNGETASWRHRGSGKSGPDRPRRGARQPPPIRAFRIFSFGVYPHLWVKTDQEAVAADQAVAENSHGGGGDADGSLGENLLSDLARGNLGLGTIDAVSFGIGLHYSSAAALAPVARHAARCLRLFVQKVAAPPRTSPPPQAPWALNSRVFGKEALPFKPPRQRRDGDHQASSRTAEDSGGSGGGQGLRRRVAVFREVTAQHFPTLSGSGLYEDYDHAPSRRRLPAASTAKGTAEQLQQGVAVLRNDSAVASRTARVAVGAPELAEAEAPPRGRHTQRPLPRRRGLRQEEARGGDSRSSKSGSLESGGGYIRRTSSSRGNKGSGDRGGGSGDKKPVMKPVIPAPLVAIEKVAPVCVPMLLPGSTWRNNLIAAAVDRELHRLSQQQTQQTQQQQSQQAGINATETNRAAAGAGIEDAGMMKPVRLGAAGGSLVVERLWDLTKSRFDVHAGKNAKGTKQDCTHFCFCPLFWEGVFTSLKDQIIAGAY